MTGKFHTGDSYILLSTVQKFHGGSFAWKIHFWLGSETSLDESGTAARKAVELDEALGGAAIQYREVQGNESDQFLSYFKSTGGVEYLAGGVASGFRTVDKDSFPIRLLHLKGKRTVRVKEVPSNIDSLNGDDVFILDKGLKLYLFNGPSANKFEKIKGIEVATRIRSDERNGRAEIIYIDDEPQNADFWGTFGGYHDPSTLPAGEPDTIPETKTTSTAPARKLFRISNATGQLLFTDVTPADGKLSKTQLDTNDVFLVQGLSHKFFVWVGKQSNIQEKREATSFALKYFEEHQIALNTQLERVSEGVESSHFKGEFAVWETPTFNQWKSSGIAQVGGEVPMDIAALSTHQALADMPVDDGTGTLQVWVVQHAEKTEIPITEHGQFYSGQCYVLLYTYEHPKRHETSYVVYFWLGKDTTPDEKGYAAVLTQQVDEAYAGKPVQTRVTQGKEPGHFRALFRGGMVVFTGKRGVHLGDHTLGDHTLGDLFHIRGTSAVNTSAVQVHTTTASALNSQDSFVLVTKTQVFAWYGAHTAPSEHAVAVHVATTFTTTYRGIPGGGRVLVEVQEGAEPVEFWDGLGGKSVYAGDQQVYAGEGIPREARLFHASTATGRFTVVPVRPSFLSSYLELCATRQIIPSDFRIL